MLLFSNKTEKYCSIKKNIRMMGSQRSDIKRDKLTENGNMMITDEISKQNRNDNDSRDIKRISSALNAQSLRLQ